MVRGEKVQNSVLTRIWTTVTEHWRLITTTRFLKSENNKPGLGDCISCDEGKSEYSLEILLTAEISSGKLNNQQYNYL